MNVRIDFSERSHGAAPATQRAHEVPLQIEDAGSSGAKTGFQHATSRLLPQARQFVRSNASCGKLVGILNVIDQQRDQILIVSQSNELFTQCQQAVASTGG